MSIVPLGNRILVKRKAVKEKTDSGIYIPDVAQEKALEGTIVALSESNYNQKGEKSNFHVKVGDRIVFGAWSSELEYDYNGENYSFMTEDSIIGVLED